MEQCCSLSGSEEDPSRQRTAHRDVVDSTASPFHSPARQVGRVASAARTRCNQYYEGTGSSGHPLSKIFYCGSHLGSSM